MIGIRARDWLN